MKKKFNKMTSNISYLTINYQQKKGLSDAESKKDRKEK